MTHSRGTFQPLLPDLGAEAPPDVDASDSLQVQATSPVLVDEVSFQEVANFPDFEQIHHGDLFTLSLSNNTASYTHGLHRFPAKFIPQIPRWAIQQFTHPSSLVLDPFMGSGTTLVESLVHERNAVGVDLDPLACLIARAKTDLPNSGSISKLGATIADRWEERVSFLKPPMPDIVDFSHWFSDEAWAKLQNLLALITTLDCTESERAFLLVVFSSIVRWVSKADDQSQKTYVSGTNPKNPPEVQATFGRFLQRALMGLRSLEIARSSSSHVTIQERSDARNLQLDPQSVDLVVTSPPYLDSVDYMYNLMLEYFWLGPLLGIPDRKTFNRLRKGYIGAKTPSQTDDASIRVRRLINEDTLSPTRARAALSYFAGMSSHFQTAARCLRTGGRYVLVVGNSQTRKDILPVHDCLLLLAADAGLELEKAFAYRIRRHYMKFPRKGRGGIILIDWVCVLRKTGQAVVEPPQLPLPWVTLSQTAVAH